MNDATALPFSTNTRADTVSPAATAMADRLAIHKSFFRSALGLTFTFGAVWGMILLLQIAFHKSFMVIGIHEVNAHAHAQIFGWVGLFVMGVAYSLFPRIRGVDLPHPKLAKATLFMVVAGIVLRSSGEGLVASHPAFYWPALAGSGIEVVAILLFLFQIVPLLRSPGRPLPMSVPFVISALGWFLVQALYGTLYFSGTGRATTVPALLRLVSTWQSSLRDIQIHGFAMLMILGVSHYVFRNLYGFRSPSRRRSLICAMALNLGVAGEAAGFILMRTGGYRWALLWCGSVLLIVASLAVLVWSWHLFSTPARRDRSLKFFRAAYGWLFLSFGMLILLPVWQFALLPRLAPYSPAVQMGFSHAYYGAVNHAITVGFISLMILGVAAKLVPMFAGLDPRRLSGLWLPFLLVNVGCAMRVGLQVATDLTPHVYGLTGASGVLEVVGLALWAVHLLRLMARSPSANSRREEVLNAPSPTL